MVGSMHRPGGPTRDSGLRSVTEHCRIPVSHWWLVTFPTIIPLASFFLKTPVRKVLPIRTKLADFDGRAGTLRITEALPKFWFRNDLGVQETFL